MPSPVMIKMNMGTRSSRNYSFQQILSGDFCLSSEKTHRRKSYLVVVALILSILLAPVRILADDTITPKKETLVPCGGFLYRAKRDDVPVYEEPSLDSSVVRRLKQSEQVCYLGEQGDFIIVQKKSDQIGTEKESNKTAVAFVRLVDVWPPPQGQVRTSFLKKTRQYMNYVLHGGVPEDPLFLVRPLIESVFSSSSDSLCGSSPSSEEDACQSPQR